MLELELSLPCINDKDQNMIFRKWKAKDDLVQNKYGVDDLYDETFVKPTLEASNLLWKECDAKAIDGSVIGTAKTIGWLSKQAQAFQSGFVRNYALFIAVGFISLLLIMF